MRTAIFIGLFTIASAISNESVFNATRDADSLLLSVIAGILIGMDISEYVLNMIKDWK